MTSSKHIICHATFSRERERERKRGRERKRERERERDKTGNKENDVTVEVGMMTSSSLEDMKRDASTWLFYNVHLHMLLENPQIESEEEKHTTFLLHIY